MTPTPHIAAQREEIAKTVIMPGDPLRAKYIAETYLAGAKLINDIRGALGYTGTYNGVRVTVMASGMGMPSIGIYSHELYNFYGVDNIIRTGTAGALRDDMDLRDIIFAQGASTNSAFASQFNLGGAFAPIADYALLSLAVRAASARNISPRVGGILTVDNYYSADPGFNDRWKALGVLAVEMEAAGLYINAAQAGKRALCICTISNHLYRVGELTAREREYSFGEMIQIALDTAVLAEGI